MHSKILCHVACLMLVSGFCCGESATSYHSQDQSCFEDSACSWQYAWLTIHSASALIAAADAGHTHNKAHKRASAVSAFTSLLGAGDLLVRPLLPRASTAETESRGVLSERIAARQSWGSHLEGWLTGLVGGLVTAGGHGKGSDGLEFFLTAGLVTELQILTLPRLDQSDRSQAVSRSWQPVIQPVRHGLLFSWRY